MAGRFLSPWWYRVEGLKPRLRHHVTVHRHHYRGKRWHILQDRSTGRFLRFNDPAYAFVGRLDGDLTVQEAWEQVSDHLGHQAPTQDEIIQVLAQLYAADVLRSSMPLDVRELFDRYQNQDRRRWRSALLNPLALRFTLFDPEKLLSRLAPPLRFLFTWQAGVAWVLLVGLAALLALTHWPEIAEALNEGLVAPKNLLILALCYPLIKALHEFGHAVAVKVWGGEVHEMGFTLLVLMPVPYVDASSAWAFKDKRKRAFVGAAGIMVEMSLAAVALFVWLTVEPGMVQAVALNVFLIGSISTLLFNGNPLLKFDAYYVLEDLTEIPNLSSRSGRYLLYLVQRYVFGLRESQSPAQAPGEKAWFLFYGPLSVIYRLVVLSAIVLYLAANFLVVGVALATWAVATQILLPMGRGLKFLFNDPRLERNRPRALAVSVFALLALAVAFLVVPVPLATRAEGVVWLPDRARVVVGTDGFVRELLVEPGQRVEIGQPVIRLETPLLDTQVAVIEARIRELKTRRAGQLFHDHVKSTITAEAITAAEADLRHARNRRDQLLLRSPVAGRLIVPDRARLLDRFVRQGDVVALVLDRSQLTVRTVVDQDDIGLIRAGVGQTSARLAQRMAEIIPVSEIREVPGAEYELPSRALGTMGGGVIDTDSSDSGGLTARDQVFQLELLLPTLREVYVGGRVFVRFDHGHAPLVSQLYRRGRQLLLRQLGV